MINPYDTAYVPAIDVFDTTGLSLPSELQCDAPTASDPGNSKYFAFVADDDEGLIFKAYWDFTNERWEWKLIDDLSDSTEVELDDCGRTVDDASFGTGVDDEQDDQFYGWYLDQTESTSSCGSCGSSLTDSLCDVAANDFGVNGYYDAEDDSLVTSVSGSGITTFPGSFAPDGLLDLDPERELTDSLWRSNTTDIYSPLYNAVIFVYGNFRLDDATGASSSQYCSSSGCTSVPGSGWMVSVISYGDIKLLDQVPYLRPANADGGFDVQLVAGRDLKIEDGLNATADVCSSGCSTTTPSDIVTAAGLFAAHEQMFVESSSTEIYGRLGIENGADCSTTTNSSSSRNSSFHDASIFYDCTNPASEASTTVGMTAWQEFQ